MIVFQFSFEFPPLDIGGIGTHAQTLHRALRAAGEKVVTIAAPGHMSSGLGSEAVRFHGPFDFPKVLAPAFVNQAMLASARLARDIEGRPDVVHCQETKSFSAAHEFAQRLGVPLVSTIHSVDLSRRGANGMTAKAQEQDRLRRTMIMTSERTIAVSESLRRDAISLLTVPPDRIAVVPNGVAEPTVTPKSRSGPVIIGYAGRFAPEKGADRLPSLVASSVSKFGVGNVRWKLAGTGALLGRVEAGLAGRGLSKWVEVLGKVESGDMTAFYQGIDLLAVPSRADSFSLVVAEAMFHGVPVIATRVGGITEVVEPGVSGLLLDPSSSAEEWANALVDMVNDPALMDEMRRYALLRVRTRYSAQAMAARTVEVYREAALR